MRTCKLRARAAITIALGCWPATAVLRAQAPDEIFYDGKVITVDSGFTIQEAFAVKGGRFSAIGSSKSVLALAGPATRVVNLQGHAVIPGLMDNHNHQYRSAAALLRGIDLRVVHSDAEVLARIRKAVAAAAPGQTVFGGSAVTPDELTEKRYPNRQELDEVAPNNPVIIYQDSTAYVNSAALRALGITKDTKVFAGGTVVQDASGEPTGRLSGKRGEMPRATAQIVPLPGPDEQKQLILRMQQEQNSYGLTSIREPDLIPEIMRLYDDLHREGKLTIRVSMGLHAEETEGKELESKLQAWGVRPGFGDHWLRLDGLGELGMDGIVESSVLREPYLEPGGNFSGELHVTPEQLHQTMSIINLYGWRPGVHVFGDRALDALLDGLEAINRETPIRDKRWVVEHITLVHPEQMDRLARLGVLVSAQAQSYMMAKRMLRSWGEQRANEAVPMRELLDHHLMVSGGSDGPDHFPSNPFVNLYFYVTRKTNMGIPLGLSEKISREEALRVLTINNAYLTWEEKEKGSIETGKLADFLVLDHDLLTVPEEQILKICPLATYVGGKEVFSAKGAHF